MLLCAKLAKQSRRSENLSRIGAYLPQIRSAYQDCRNCLEEEGIYESLDHKDVKHPSYHVEKAFGMPLGSFFYRESPAAKLQKPTVSPDPLAKTLERYARESCLICSAHQVSFVTLFLHFSLLSRLRNAVSYPWKIRRRRREWKRSERHNR